jgi:hypothetical protein
LHVHRLSASGVDGYLRARQGADCDSRLIAGVVTQARGGRWWEHVEAAGGTVDILALEVGATHVGRGQGERPNPNVNPNPN